jgi:hypothetical protein
MAREVWSREGEKVWLGNAGGLNRRGQDDSGARPTEWQHGARAPYGARWLAVGTGAASSVAAAPMGRA